MNDKEFQEYAAGIRGLSDKSQLLMAIETLVMLVIGSSPDEKVLLGVVLGTKLSASGAPDHFRVMVYTNAGNSLKNDTFTVRQMYEQRLSPFLLKLGGIKTDIHMAQFVDLLYQARHSLLGIFKLQAWIVRRGFGVGTALAACPQGFWALGLVAGVVGLTLSTLSIL